MIAPELVDEAPGLLTVLASSLSRVLKVKRAGVPAVRVPLQALVGVAALASQSAAPRRATAPVVSSRLPSAR